MNVSISEYGQLQQASVEDRTTYALWTIDDPHRAWTNPLSLSLRVKRYNGAPYCTLLGSKKVFTATQFCISNVSSDHCPLEEQAIAAKLFPINQALLFHSPGYDILPSNTVSQNSGRVSVMELHLSVDRSILPYLAYAETSDSVVNRHLPHSYRLIRRNQYGLTDYFAPNLGILQASSYPASGYYGGGGEDPPNRPSGSGKDTGFGQWQDDDPPDYRQGSAGGSSGGNNEDSGPSKRKKTAIACHSCRKRKLKCDGLQPCHACAEKSRVCTYDSYVKRRGPGKKSLQQESSTEQPKKKGRKRSSSSSRPRGSSSALVARRTTPSPQPPPATLPQAPYPQYGFLRGEPPPLGLAGRVASRFVSDTRHSGQMTERYVESYPSSSSVHTQQLRSSASTHYPPQSSTSYPEYQQSSYRDQSYRDQPPSYQEQPPLPPSLPDSYHPAEAEQYYRQNYPSSSSSYRARAEHSSQRQSYAEEKEEYVSEDDDNTSSRREPSPEYEGDIRGRATDTRR